MARVKKFQNPAGSITPEDKQKDKTLVPQTQPSEVYRANQIKTVYGDVDPTESGFSQFMAEKMGGYTGDDAVKRQFEYVNNLYKSGGLSQVTESGAGIGADDPSLTDKKARRKQYLWGSNENFDRQRAAEQYRNWTQEYAKQKYAPKPVTKRKFDFDVYNRAKAAAGGDESFLGGSLTHENRAKFGRQALESMFKDVSDGDWTDDKYEGDENTKSTYGRLRGINQQEFFKDYDEMIAKSLKNDKKIDQNEMAAFVSKYGINPSKLFGDVTKTQAEIDAKAAAKAAADKTTADAASKAATDRAAAIAEMQNRSGFGERLHFTGGEKDNVKNLKNYTLFDKDSTNTSNFYSEYSDWDPYSNKEFSGYWVKGKHYGDSPTNPYQQKTADYQDFINLMAGAKEEYTRRFNIPTSVARRTDMAAQYLYKRGFVNMSNSFPDYKYSKSEPILAVRGSNGQTEHSLFRNGKEYKGKLVYSNGGVKFEYKDDDGVIKSRTLGRYQQSNKYTYDLPGGSSSTGTGKVNETFNTNVKKAKDLTPESGANAGKPVFGRKKQGGIIDFNKIEKFQFGGTLYKSTGPVTQEQANQTFANRQNELKRKATVGEIKQSAGSDRFELTQADKWELAALGLDLGGTAASFFGPLGSAIGAGAGVAGTATQFAADVARNGLDWGDVGRGAMGLGMDALSIIPGAKMFKTSKTLAKVMPKVKLGLMAMGATDVGSKVGGIYDKLQKDGFSSLNTDDLRTIVTGIQLLAGGAHATSRKLGTTKGNQQFGVKVDKQDVKFNTQSEAINFGKSKQAYDKAKVELENYKNNNKDLAEGDQKLASLTKNVEDTKAKVLSDLNGRADDSVIEGALKTGRGSFGKTGDKFYSYGRKEGDAKITESSDKVIKNFAAKNADGTDKYSPLEQFFARRQANAAQHSNDWVNKYFATGMNVEGFSPAVRGVKALPVGVTKGKEEGTMHQPIKNKPVEKPVEEGKAVSTEKTTPTTPVQNTGQLALQPAGVPLSPRAQLQGNSYIDRALANVNNRLALNQASQSGNLPAVVESVPTAVITGRPTKALDSPRGRRVIVVQANTAQDNRMPLGMSKAETEKFNNQQAIDAEIDRINAEFGQGQRTNKTRKELREEAKGTGDNNYESDAKRSKKAKRKSRAIKERQDEKAKNLYMKAKNGGILKAQGGTVLSFADKYKNANIGNNLNFNNSAAWGVQNFNVSLNNAQQSKINQFIPTFTLANSKLNDPKSLAQQHTELKSKIAGFNPTSNTLDFKPYDVKSNSTRHEAPGAPQETLGSQVKAGLEKALSPQLMKYVNTKITNRKLLDEVNKMKQPTGMVAPVSTKLQNVGMSSAMGQLNQIDQQVASQRPMSSDAKLNAVMQMGANKRADDMRNQVWQGLNQQNHQINNQNAQLSTQDAVMAAETAAKNAAMQKQHDDFISKNKMALISSEGQSRDNLLSEWQKRREDAKTKSDSIKDQEFLNTINDKYTTKIEALKTQFPNYATTQSAEYTKAANAIAREKQKEMLEYQKTNYGKTPLFGSGGSLEDKKALEAYKAELKAKVDSDKDFNKMIIEKMKSHEKMLSLLLKGK